jgi:hypothetical protein
VTKDRDLSTEEEDLEGGGDEGDSIKRGTPAAARATGKEKPGRTNVHAAWLNQSGGALSDLSFRNALLLDRSIGGLPAASSC